MPFYRYQLADNVRNEGVNSRSINGYRLDKTVYLISTKKINFEGFQDLVTEEEAATREGFDELDRAKAKAEQLKKVEAGRNRIAAQKKEQEQELAKSSSYAEEDLMKMTKKALQDLLLSKGFKEEEYAGMSKAALVQMLMLGEEVQ